MSRGRHRGQTRTGRHTAAIVTGGAFALLPVALAGCSPAAEQGRPPGDSAPAPATAPAPSAPEAAPAPAAPVPAVAAASYTVRAGDTLSAIAADKGTSWTALWEANRAEIADPSLIHPGITLHLPVRGGPAPAGATSTKPAPSTPVKQAPPAKQVAGKQTKIDLTGYSWQDNTPAGSAKVSSPVLHQTAGGQGTYADPITVAVPGGAGNAALKPGTRFYLPSVRRYVIVEDTGASPPKATGTHLDMWIDGRSGTRSATDACMDRITGTVPAELNPPAGRPVIAGPIFNGGACHVPQP
ncbi:MAG: LysM peptidoglycan-binding domain-containing protein [Pseudonocardia sp.]|nr:LysM peptidoglycan-binding domain-containing protein [Pseudonocardia sp.]